MIKQGLLVEGMPDLRDYQAPYARPAAEVRGWADGTIDLLTTVRQVRPTILTGTSTSPGAFDKAVVTADGNLHGWVGGGCAQPAVVRTVRQVLNDGRARLIRIAPTDDGHERDLGDVLEFGMACHSGGTLELFVDPVLPHAQLVVLDFQDTCCKGLNFS